MHAGSSFSILCMRIDMKVYPEEMDLLLFPPFSHYLLLFFSSFSFSLHPCSVRLQLSIDVLHTAAKPLYSRNRGREKQFDLHTRSMISPAGMNWKNITDTPVKTK